MTYSKQLGALYLISYGGEGGGGSGSIWSVNSAGNKKVLHSFGTGCAPDPIHFGGIVAGKLWFARVETTGESIPSCNRHIRSLIAVDLETQASNEYSFLPTDKFNLYNLEATKYSYKIKDKQYLVLSTDDYQYYLFDPITQTVGEKIEDRSNL